MTQLLQVSLDNAAIVAILSALLLVITRLCRRPQLAHALWVLLLIKLVTPPLVALPCAGWFSLGIPATGQSTASSAVNNVSQPGRPDIRLTRPATVRGRVVDGEGQGVARRYVRASAADLLGNRYYDPMSETDDAGKFELRLICPGRHHIQVAPFWVRATQAPAGSTRDVDLVAGQIHEDIELLAGPESR